MILREKQQHLTWTTIPFVNFFFFFFFLLSFLHNVPMHIRFGLNGFFTNVLFMIAYNFAVVQFEHVASSSTIYATVYLIFIPVTHACISLLVFGWPERYMRSLMSNAPVGLTGEANYYYCTTTTLLLLLLLVPFPIRSLDSFLIYIYNNIFHPRTCSQCFLFFVCVVGGSDRTGSGADSVFG